MTRRTRSWKECGIGFEDVVFHIERGDLLDVLEHPNPDRHAGQRIFVVRREWPWTLKNSDRDLRGRGETR